MMAASWWIKK